METIGSTVALSLAALAIVGVVLTFVQLTVLRWHRHLASPNLTAAIRPGISILKPLCGLDDDLAANLAAFAQLPYPRYEVLLGLCSSRDPALGLATALAAANPGRFRIVFQQGDRGLNPKVNQLIGLAEAARYDLLVISDSNTRVSADYLDEIAALLSDPKVGLVTHALAGVGDDAPGACLGAILDNLHLTGTITPGFVAAKQVCQKNYVVGKSMALRRQDLKALGGFEIVKDVLAEDFVLGRLIPEKLGKEVVLGGSVVQSVSTRRSVGDFVRRYARWSVMQRQCAGLPAYVGLLLMNPLLLATAAWLVRPGLWTAGVWVAVAAGRIATHAVAGRQLRGFPFSMRALMWVPLKELLVGYAWLAGLTTRTIEWRSHRLIVRRGSALAPVGRRRFRRFPESDTARTSAAA